MNKLGLKIIIFKWAFIAISCVIILSANPIRIWAYEASTLVFQEDTTRFAQVKQILDQLDAEDTSYAHRWIGDNEYLVVGLKDGSLKTFKNDGNGWQSIDAFSDIKVQSYANPTFAERGDELALVIGGGPGTFDSYKVNKETLATEKIDIFGTRNVKDMSSAEYIDWSGNQTERWLLGSGTKSLIGLKKGTNGYESDSRFDGIKNHEQVSGKYFLNPAHAIINNKEYAAIGREDGKVIIYVNKESNFEDTPTWELDTIIDNPGGARISTVEWTKNKQGEVDGLLIGDKEGGLRYFTIEENTTLINNDKGERIPKDFRIYQNYPNPFNPNTTIRYDINKRTHVKIEIFGVNGNYIRTLVNAQKDAGTYEVKWDGRNKNNVPVASGVYFYRIQVGKTAITKRMVLMK